MKNMIENAKLVWIMNRANLLLSAFSIITGLLQLLLFMKMAVVVFAYETAIAGVIILLPGYFLYRICAYFAYNLAKVPDDKEDRRNYREEFLSRVPIWMRIPIFHLHVGIYYILSTILILIYTIIKQRNYPEYNEDCLVQRWEWLGE
jgi:hypothetical protein